MRLLDPKCDKKLLEEFVQKRLYGCERGNRESTSEAIAVVQLKDDTDLE